MFFIVTGSMWNLVNVILETVTLVPLSGKLSRDPLFVTCWYRLLVQKHQYKRNNLKYTHVLTQTHIHT